MEVVQPVKVEIPSLRAMMDVKLDETEWVRARFDQLNLIDAKRLAAICHMKLYHERMKKAFDKQVRPRSFQAGDLMLKRILHPNNTDARGKWAQNYEGPYVVKKVFSGGSLLLSTMDDEDFPLPVNADAVKNTSHKINTLSRRLRQKWASRHITKRKDLGKNKGRKQKYI